MPRKQQGNLKIMIDAVARIKSVRENDDGQNPEFSQALDIAEKYLLDKLYAKARDTIKPNRKATAKPGSAEKKDLPVRQN